MNTEAQIEYNRRRLEALGIAESIVMRLQELARGPAVNWGHVGNLASARDDLLEIEDRLFSKGEYAPENVGS